MQASLGALTVKRLQAMQEMQVWSLGPGRPPGEGMATHSSILAWRIPWMRSLVGHSLGLQRVVTYRFVGEWRERLIDKVLSVSFTWWMLNKW